MHNAVTLKSLWLKDRSIDRSIDWWIASKRHIAAQKTLYEQLQQEHQRQQELLHQIILEEEEPEEKDVLPAETNVTAELKHTLSGERKQDTIRI